MHMHSHRCNTDEISTKKTVFLTSDLIKKEAAYPYVVLTLQIHFPFLNQRIINCPGESPEELTPDSSNGISKDCGLFPSMPSGELGSYVTIND